MRTSGRSMVGAALMATGLLFCLHAGRAAQDNEEPADTTAKHDAGVQSAPETQLLYIPPDRGAPEVRVSGGTRGASNDGLRIDVLSPDQTGLTIQVLRMGLSWKSWACSLTMTGTSPGTIQS